MRSIGLFGKKYVNVDRREYELGPVGFEDFATKVRDVLERRTPTIKVCLRP